jgi:hypothetical protein
VSTTTATDPKPEPMQFDSKEERENYYRWVYCVKNNITDMESYGVKPPGSYGPAAAASPVSQSPVLENPPPASGYVSRRSAAPKPGGAMQLEMSKPMVIAFLLLCKSFSLCTGAIWLAWQMCAVVTAMVILGMIIGVLIA